MDKVEKPEINVPFQEGSGQGSSFFIGTPLNPFTGFHRGITYLSTKLSTLLWKKFLFQDLYRCVQLVILLQLSGDLVSSMHDSGVVPATKLPSDLLQGN